MGPAAGRREDEPRDGGRTWRAADASDDGVGEAGCWTAPEHRGGGPTAEALGVLAGWAPHAVHRVELLVDPANVGSRRVAEAAGSTAEGRIRQRFLHRGRPSDVVLHARPVT